MVRGSGHIRAYLCAVAALGALAAPVRAGSDDLTTTAVKRFFLAEANARCGLLDGPAAMAVTAGYLQARNSLIRMTGSLSGLSPYLSQAREAAAQITCDAPQLLTEAAVAANAYRSYVVQPRLTLPGDRAQWLGDRTHGNAMAWRLVQFQSNPEADLAIGLYGTLEDNRFVVMARFDDGEVPYSARLIVRDASVTPGGLINRAPYGLSDQAPLGFASETGTQTFLPGASNIVAVQLTPQVRTNAVGVTATGKYVGKQGPVEARRFDFPTRAWRAIAPLDPREEIVVAFDFRDGTRYARFEVGDFMTGLGYVRLPSAYGGPIGTQPPA